ncbi:serine--tRNA ligase [Thiospirochaeta perfilievii]|uniref:Serine--tRNA ligase n=1 Tax=Thiospirochaeta perfilievii TaxID=252967 RepID=A0A5C1QFW3_9SPIO|nr:serine--tRNA ligase [Thiospirochaeta perfilievii]QEN05484.1 serine--tRNA ligase [Thiospirochaeta perfilievii]
MLDLKFIRDNVEAVKANVKNRFMEADVDLVVELYTKYNESLSKVEELRRQANENASKMKGKLSQEERTVFINKGKELKAQIASIDSETSDLKSKLSSEASKIPNMAHPDAPIGKEDKENFQIKVCGTVPNFDFKPLDHVEIGEKLDLIEFERATKVSGPKFYYLKNEAAILEMALTRYAVDILMKKGFRVSITPDIAKVDILEGIGFNPRGSESNIYSIEGTDMCLVGTAEITLGGYHAGEIIDLSNGPIFMAGISHCFRREAGAAGQYSKGIYRVHQFTKIEMFIYCRPEESDKLHETLREIEEEIFNGLEVPFRVVDTCTGDLGSPAYRKYDLEAWMPGRGESGDWGEITSTSNCTDYQARRLGVRYKDENGKTAICHTLNGTAIAISRALIAIIENNQQADGSVTIPKALVPYTGFDTIKAK